MQDPVATAIVCESLALSVSHAHAPAVDVLDLVMRGRHDRLLDFGLHMVPPDPFAILVAQAMGDPMPAEDWEAFTGPEADPRLRAAMRLQFALNLWPLFLQRYNIG
ncbi:MAG: hypothetical protein JNJ42_16130 [Burkholderiaceae bacterium]|jgi:hypothetical protein|nr:hypothetical protein [Burkholderiaceae bacterium]